MIIGRIATLARPGRFGWTDAIAIRDGRVAAAGSEGTVRDAVRAQHVLWRLGEERVVLPGITDAHLHLASAALSARQLDLTELVGRDAVLGAIGAAHEAMRRAGDEDGWLLGYGWSLDHMRGRPDAAALEVVAPGRPVALWSHDHHSRWVSERALVLAGLDRTTRDPAGGELGRRPDGAPDGLLFEGAATLADAVIPAPVAADLEAAVVAYAKVLATLGVTGAHDPGEVIDEPAMERGPSFFRALAAAGRLPMRVVASVREEQLPAAMRGSVVTGASFAPSFGGDPDAARHAARYRDGWLKLFADGALGSRSAALLEPYEASDPAGPSLGGPRGMLVRDHSSLLGAARAAAGAGIATQIHGIGDAAVRLALDVLEGVPRPGIARHRVEHAQLVSAVDAPRFAALGIAASVQPCHLIADAEPARLAWGARTSRAFPLRDLDRLGVLIPFGTDAPVEPPDPWRGIAAAVSRTSGGWDPDRGAFHPEQGIPLWRALRAAARDPARSLGVADEGHLGVGARADLLVLPAEVIDEPPGAGGALESARPLATLIDGEIAWRAPTFDP